MSNALAVRHTTADSTARSNAASAAQVKRYWPGRAPDWYEQQQAAAEDSEEEEDREAEPEEETAATTVAAPVVLKKVSSFASKYLTSLGCDLTERLYICHFSGCCSTEVTEFCCWQTDAVRT